MNLRRMQTAPHLNPYLLPLHAHDPSAHSIELTELSGDERIVGGWSDFGCNRTVCDDMGFSFISM